MNKKNFLSIIISFFVFATLNIPSLKIIYSSEIVNISIVFGLWIFGLVRIILLKNSVIRLTVQMRKFILFFILMWWTILLVTLINSYSSFDFQTLIRCLVAMLYVLGACIFIEYSDVKKVLRMQIVWSLLLSIVQLTVGIKLNISLGQHYLTLGMPIAAGVISSFFLLFYVEKSKFVKIFLVISLISSLLALTSLSGRSPVILAVLVPILFLIIIFIRENNFKNKIKMIILFVTMTPLFSVIIYKNISDKWLLRFQKLSNPEDEPRDLIYKESLNIIKNNIFGTGINSSKVFGIYYPHNIFLEVTISGGIIALIVFLCIAVQLLSKAIESTKMKSISVCCGALAVFFFLTWNISFDLTTSYIPFVSILLLISVIDYEKYIID